MKNLLHEPIVHYVILNGKLCTVFLILSRRNPIFRLKKSLKMTLIRETELITDISDGTVGIF